MRELEFNNIPQLIVFNKSDLLDADSLHALQRTVLFDKDRESVSVSAIKPQTLKPLLDKIGEVLAKDSEQVNIARSIY